MTDRFAERNDQSNVLTNFDQQRVSKYIHSLIPIENITYSTI